MRAYRLDEFATDDNEDEGERSRTSSLWGARSFVRSIGSSFGDVELASLGLFDVVFSGHEHDFDAAVWPLPAFDAPGGFPSLPWGRRRQGDHQQQRFICPQCEYYYDEYYGYYGYDKYYDYEYCD